MRVLAGEAWSFQRYVENHVLAHCATFRTLRRFLVMLTACLDEGRLHGHERAHALLVPLLHEPAAQDPAHSLEWMWPYFGCTGPGGETGDATSTDRARGDHDHREAAAFEEAKEKLSGAAPSTSPNACRSECDVRAVSGRVEAASWCPGPRSGRSASRRVWRQEGRSRQGQRCVSGDAPGLPRHGWELFSWCLRELAPRSVLKAEAHRAVQQTFNPSPGAASHREDRSTATRQAQSRW